MLCSGRIITCSFAPQKPSPIHRGWRDKPPALIRWRSAATGDGASEGESVAAAATSSSSSFARPGDVNPADSSTAG